VAKTSIKPAPRTTQSLIAGLRERGGDVRQQIIAHETLARLRAERTAAMDTARVAQLDADIRFWLGFVDEDIDQPAPASAGDED
jgi:hypothetical protein